MAASGDLTMLHQVGLKAVNFRFRAYVRDSRTSLAWGCALLIGLATPAGATTAAGHLSATITIAASCVMDSVATHAMVAIRCNNPTPYSLGLIKAGAATDSPAFNEATMTAEPGSLTVTVTF
jgi:hypothetical protein